MPRPLSQLHCGQHFSLSLFLFVPLSLLLFLCIYISSCFLQIMSITKTTRVTKHNGSNADILDMLVWVICGQCQAMHLSPSLPPRVWDFILIATCKTAKCQSGNKSHCDGCISRVAAWNSSKKPPGGGLIMSSSITTSTCCEKSCQPGLTLPPSTLPLPAALGVESVIDFGDNWFDFEARENADFPVCAHKRATSACRGQFHTHARPACHMPHATCSSQSMSVREGGEREGVDLLQRMKMKSQPANWVSAMKTWHTKANWTHCPHHPPPKASMGALSLCPPSPYPFYLPAATTFTACQFLPCSPSRKLQVERRINDSKCRGNPGSLPALPSFLPLSRYPSLCCPSIFAISFCALLCNCFKLISQMRNF